MEEAVGAVGVPYIESILHASFNQVSGAWYNQALGNYAAAAAQANWRGDDVNWLQNRQHSATMIRNALVGAGAGADHLGAVEVFGAAPVVAQQDVADSGGGQEEVAHGGGGQEEVAHGGE